ncbi:MAG: D-alanyl-D-alanine carboxypeptidase [Berryella intestinalis]|uniref:D-alanyl-D-alanine carboxypeptidase family protein n=1 Tax=Berryella intestinalis TaxID=1531429 RepID=UPI002A75C255|nr:D-alanyl-D-alanine carboxypeptidase [Berryella intestinalis]MDY3128840.1 D-alanyl-D-alanine carboxypeptidase [Berryella intestinalis]
MIWTNRPTGTDSAKGGACSLVALSLAAALAFPALPAFADVRRSDQIGDSTVEGLGLSVGDCPDVAADYAVLVDSEGNPLFQRDANAPAQIASITKVMTALVSMDYLELDEQVSVSDAAATIGESSANLMAGDIMSFETALKALLVPSGNDAAVAIAETAGAAILEKEPGLADTPAAAFVAKMNAKAKELGCADTVYENPHGLDDGSFAGTLHSTAADQALVARKAMENDTIAAIVKGGSTSIVVKRNGANTQIDLETTDALLEMYDRAIGIKTGETLLAGPSFMGAASDGSMKLYAVVLHSDTAQTRFDDAQALFEWGYRHYVDYRLVNADQTVSMAANSTVTEVPLVAQVELADRHGDALDVTISDPNASVRVFDLDGNVSQDVQIDDSQLSGVVKAGQKVGTISFKQHNDTIARYDLLAAETVDAPGIFDRISNWFWGLFASSDDRQNVVTVHNNTPIIKNNQKNQA